MIFLFLIFLCLNLNSFENRIILNSNSDFSFVKSTQNLSLDFERDGRKGFFVKKLSIGNVEKSDDLVLVYQDNEIKDLKTNYFIDSRRTKLDKSISKLGVNSFLFYSNQNPINIIPLSSNALFSSNKIIDEFSLNMWIYRTAAIPGESILDWSGYIVLNESSKEQIIRLVADNNDFYWNFQNVFFKRDGSPLNFKIKLNRQLLFKKWYLHTIRYSQKDGALEYLINGERESIFYLDSRERESGEYFLRLGNFIHFILGNYFTGAIEGFKLSNSFNSPIMQNYSTQKGVLITKPIKLSTGYSQVLSLKFNDSIPENTNIIYYYRTSNKLIYEDNSNRNVESNLNSPWVYFNPNEELNVFTKYIQFKAELFPEGLGNSSPAFFGLEISYVKEPNPPAPIILKSKVGSNIVEIEWKASKQSNIAGYYIYFGYKPRHYIAETKFYKSPVDVGNKTSFILEGLENGRVYYISVVPYNSEREVSEESFSQEIIVRPLEILKNYE